MYWRPPEVKYGDTRDFLAEKVLSCGVALAIVFFMSPAGVLDTYTVLGQAHFFLAYLYAARAGKVDVRNILLFFLCASVLFFLSFHFPSGITFVAACSLVFHVYVGEVQILKKKMSWTYLAPMAGIAVVNGSWLANILWSMTIPVDLICWAIGLFFAGGAVFSENIRRHFKEDVLFVFLTAVLAFYMAIELSGHVPSPYKTFGFIVLTHYLTFYVVMGRRFARQGVQSLRFFMRACVLVNLVMLAGYLAVQWFPAQTEGLYEVWYMPVSFYVWTLMHFISTFRPSDFSGLMPVFRSAVQGG